MLVFLCLEITRVTQLEYRKTVGGRAKVPLLNDPVLPHSLRVFVIVLVYMIARFLSRSSAAQRAMHCGQNWVFNLIADE